MVQKSDHR